MYILRIEHSVVNYDEWKKAFDSDPAGREKSGVQFYRVSRPIDDSKSVMIDLEFETQEQAENLQTALSKIWKDIQGKIIINPKTRIVKSLEEKRF